jgi:toxin CcdB
MQFDVYKNPRGGLFPLLLDIQADFLVSLATRVVVPMAPRKKWGARPMTGLNPLATLGGVEYVLAFQELAAIQHSSLGALVGSLADRRADLIGAIDLLVTGA